MSNLKSNTANAAFAQFDTETVTVVRVSKGATPGTFTNTTIYSGAADLQSGSGSSYMSASGTAIQADAELNLEPVSGINPAIEPGDIVTCNGAKYTIVQVSPWTYPIQYVNALLRLGVQTNKPLK